MKRAVKAMDRLTQIIDGQQCTVVSDDKIIEYRYGDDIDRLAAYEDTGLTPSEIEQLKADNARLHKLVDNIERVIKGECVDE